jgi:hypothetical protein
MIAGMETTAQAQLAEARAAFEGLEIVLHQEKKIAKKLQTPSPLPLSHREGKQWK